MDNTSRNSENWRLFGSNVTRSEVVYITQVILIYIIVITCIVNLSIKVGDSNLWTALLSSCLGYLLPNPTLKKK